MSKLIGFEKILALSPIPHLKWLRSYKFVPASPSSVGRALLCGLQFKHAYGIDVPKLEFVSGEAAQYGIWVHNEIENHILRGTAIDKDVYLECPSVKQRVAHYMRQIDKAQGYSPEIKLAANSTGIVEWEDRTIGAIADLTYDPSFQHKIIIDWKTNNNKNSKGEYRSPYTKPFQLEMLAIMSFIENPELQRVTAIFEFLRHGLTYTYEFERDKWTYIVTNGKGKQTEKDFLFPTYMEKYWSTQLHQQFWENRNPLCYEYCDVKECQFNGTKSWSKKK